MTILDDYQKVSAKCKRALEYRSLSTTDDERYHRPTEFLMHQSTPSCNKKNVAKFTNVLKTVLYPLPPPLDECTPPPHKNGKFEISHDKSKTIPPSSVNPHFSGQSSSMRSSSPKVSSLPNEPASLRTPLCSPSLPLWSAKSKTVSPLAQQELPASTGCTKHCCCVEGI
jgi:hypothetical protein